MGGKPGTTALASVGGAAVLPCVGFCDLPHKDGIKGDGVQLAVVSCLVGLLLIAAAVTVGYEDQRAARRHARQRRARLARLGESDPLARQAAAELR